MAFNAATAYQNNKINTATPADLTLMLYEGAIKFCNIAIIGIEEINYNKANNNIIKAEKIITYLRDTLDFKYEVAQDFENMYRYIYDRMIHANIHKDKETIEEVLGHLREIRDTWKNVISANKY